jgi:hypothetical protein
MKIRIRLALAVVSVILVISLAVNGFLYNSLSENNNLEKQNEDLQSQINSLQAENSTLQNDIANLKIQVINLTSQLSVVQQQINSSQIIISALQSQNANLQNLLELKNAPNLVTSLGIDDIGMYGFPNQTNVRLYIAGSVYNNGTETAYNCRLHVIAFRGDQTIIDTNITLGIGTMSGGSSVNVNENIPYSGGPLSNVKIIPEWTNTP